MSFQPGDRVRLKLKPEVEFTLTELGTSGRWCGRTDRQFFNEKYDVYHRWPEEIELVPRPIQVGDRVQRANAPDLVGTIIAEFTYRADRMFAVDWEVLDYPCSYLADDLERKA